MVDDRELDRRHHCAAHESRFARKERAQLGQEAFRMDERQFSETLSNHVASTCDI